MNPLLPKPGQGPSEKAMNEGSVECEFIGTATSGVRVQAVLKAQGDAGNRFTVKCLCESAFVLALSAEAHSGPKPGTCWPDPASSFDATKAAAWVVYTGT